MKGVHRQYKRTKNTSVHVIIVELKIVIPFEVNDFDKTENNCRYDCFGLI